MTSPVYDQKVAAAIWHNFGRVLKGHSDQNIYLMLFCDLESHNIYWAITTGALSGALHMPSSKKKTKTLNPIFTSLYLINTLKLGSPKDNK